MDLRALLEGPTEVERAAVDDLLGPPESGWDGGHFTGLDGHVAYGGHAARERRNLLLPALHAVQDAAGSVSKGALGYISERLTVPPAEAYGVATFYALINTVSRAPTLIHVCDDIVCARYGADELKRSVEQELGPPSSTGPGISWAPSPCLGQCDRAPAALIHTAGSGYRNVAPAEAASLSRPRLRRAAHRSDPPGQRTSCAFSVESVRSTPRVSMPTGAPAAMPAWKSRSPWAGTLSSPPSMNPV